MRYCAAVILGLWLVPCAPASADAPPLAPDVVARFTLVENGGFEEGAELPSYWRRHPAQNRDGHRLLRDTTVARTGRASGLVLQAPLETGRPGPNLQWNRYGIPVEGGASLLVSCHVKTEGTRPFRVGCHFYDAARRHLGFRSVPLPRRESSWVSLCEQVAVPPAARQMGFVLYASGTGKTWFDDVAVLGTPEVTASRGTPKIDGKLDDACWTQDNRLSQFVVPDGSRFASTNTLAWLACDDRALYVAMHCPGPPDTLHRDARDGTQPPNRLDEHVEIWLDPDHNHDDFLYLRVEASGRIRSTRGVREDWKCGAETRTHRAADAWSAEVRIPYERLGIGSRTGAVWGVNLGRYDAAHGERSLWSLGAPHDPTRFGNLRLTADLWPFQRADFDLELDHRQQQIDQFRAAMRGMGMTRAAMDRPNELLDRARDRLHALRRRIAQVTADDPTELADLQSELAALSQAVPAARRLASEYLFTTNESESGGFRVALANALQKIPRDRDWAGGLFASRIQLQAAQDESESFQLVVIPSAGALDGVRITAEPLEGPGGGIPLSWYRVGYVETVPPKYPTEYVGWWPDPLLPAEPFDVPAAERRPLWFRVDVPADAEPGQYGGRVTIASGDQQLSVPVELRVRDFRLPRPGTLATAFGNYASALADGYFGTGDYRKTLRIEDYARWCEFMGTYRLGPKNAGREYVSIARDGPHWRADLSALKHTVGKLASRYFAPRSVALHRLPSAPQLDRPGYEPDPREWARQTRAIAAQWRKLGLPERTYLYGIDEPREDQYAFVHDTYEQIHELVPGLPIMQTVNHQVPDPLRELVDIWCPLSSRLESDFYRERLQAGDTLWVYVCCSPTHPYANFFIDRPATEHRLLFWQTWQAEARGFLYWCCCWWKGLPTPGSAQPAWPEVPIRMRDHAASGPRQINGDGLLIYPGPQLTPYPSIRLEVIRDGIEDYEYLALLKRLRQEALTRGSLDPATAELLDRAAALGEVPASISRSMTEYTRDPADIYARRAEIGDMIEQLATRDAGRD